MDATSSSLYKGHRYPVEIISHCVWLYHRFPLSLREVEEMMLARGVLVTYETVHQWSRKFGQAFANGLRRRRPRPGDKWHLDEVFIKIHYLWRAVDQDGTMLDILVTSHHDAKAATRLFRKLLTGLRSVPRVLVTDKPAREVRSTDAQKLISLVVREMNDEITVRDYGHGFLMTLPLTYWDDDRVTLFVEPFESGYRVSDRGSTAVRLHMTGMNVETPKVAESWRRSVAALSLVNPGHEELELAHFTDADQLGESILKVAEASLRIDQLRWLHSAQTPVRFTDEVVRRLVRAAGEPAAVRPNAPVKLRHGRTRHVTAAVGTDERRQVYVQAVGGSNRETRERAVEHCTHLFDYAEGLDPDQRLAIVSGTGEEWRDYYETLTESAEVAFYGEPDQLDEVLKRRLAPALT